MRLHRDAGFEIQQVSGGIQALLQLALIITNTIIKTIRSSENLQSVHLWDSFNLSAKRARRRVPE